MLILLLGPPGAGKGTQGDLLVEKLAIPKIATGDALRAAVRDGTQQGREAKAYMDRGDLVPDSVILGIMREVLSDPKTKSGAILDGVVRTTPQAEGLSRMLGELGRNLDAVLAFDVDDEEVVRRLGGRTVCGKCQTPYMGREPGSTCEKCGGRLERRKDDDPAAIRNRLAVYREQTEPVLGWYTTHQTPVVRINASGPVDDVTKRALRGLGR